jgi:hypothetical protein
MASKRVIHFANLPLKMLLPKSLENIKEVAFKTVPSASKVTITGSSPPRVSDSCVSLISAVLVLILSAK